MNTEKQFKSFFLLLSVVFMISIFQIRLSATVIPAKTYPYALKTPYGTIIIKSAADEPQDINDIEEGNTKGIVLYTTVGNAVRSVYTVEAIRSINDNYDGDIGEIIEAANDAGGVRSVSKATTLLANLELLGANDSYKKVKDFVKSKKSNSDPLVKNELKEAGLTNDALIKTGRNPSQLLEVAANFALLGGAGSPGENLTPAMADAMDKVKNRKNKKDIEAVRALADLVSSSPVSGQTGNADAGKAGKIPGFSDPMGTGAQKGSTSNSSNPNNPSNPSNPKSGNSNSNSSKQNTKTDKIDKIPDFGGGGEKPKGGNSGGNSADNTSKNTSGGETFTITEDMHTTSTGSTVVEWNLSGSSTGEDGNYTTYYYEDGQGWHYYVENAEGDMVGWGDGKPPERAKAGDATSRVKKDEAILPGEDPKDTDKKKKGTESQPIDEYPPLPPQLEAVIKLTIARFKEWANIGFSQTVNAGSTYTTPNPDETSRRPSGKRDPVALLRSYGVKRIFLLGNPGTPLTKPKTGPIVLPDKKNDGRTDPPRNKD
jgi:hypothetical protein